MLIDVGSNEVVPHNNKLARAQTFLCRWYFSFLDSRDMSTGKVRQYRHDEGSHVHDVNDGLGPLGSLHILVSTTGGRGTLFSRSFEPARQSWTNRGRESRYASPIGLLAIAGGHASSVVGHMHIARGGSATFRLRDVEWGLASICPAFLACDAVASVQTHLFGKSTKMLSE